MDGHIEGLTSFRTRHVAAMLLALVLLQLCFSCEHHKLVLQAGRMPASKVLLLEMLCKLHHERSATVMEVAEYESRARQARSNLAKDKYKN